MLDNRFVIIEQNRPIRTYQPNLPAPKFVFAEEGPNLPARNGDGQHRLPGLHRLGRPTRATILGPDSRINSYAHVSDLILFEGVNVGRYAKIRSAIIDKGVTFPRASRSATIRSSTAAAASP